MLLPAAAPEPFAFGYAFKHRNSNGGSNGAYNGGDSACGAGKQRPRRESMKKTARIGVVLVFGLGGAVVATAKAPPPATPEAVTINAGDVKWGEAPATFPKGAQLAVLHGDPSKKEQFALRFKMP